MTASLATFGYASKDLNVEQEIQWAFAVNAHTLLIDTRYKPWSSWEIWKQASLAKRYGQRYRWMGQLLGNIHHNTPDKPIQLANEAKGIPLLCQWLEQNIPLILLCGCADYDCCHRSVIYEKVEEQLEGRLPEFFLGQRVITPRGAGRINPHIPLDVQRARNRYTVILDVYHPINHYFPHELEPFDAVQQQFVA